MQVPQNREQLEQQALAAVDPAKIEQALAAVAGIAVNVHELLARFQVSGAAALAQQEFAKTFYSLLDAAELVEKTVHAAGGRRKAVTVRWTGSGGWTRESYERRVREINSGSLDTLSYYHQNVIGAAAGMIGQTHGYPVAGSAKLAPNGNGVIVKIHPSE